MKYNYYFMVFTENMLLRYKLFRVLLITLRVLLRIYLQLDAHVPTLHCVQEHLNLNRGKISVIFDCLVNMNENLI